METPSSGFLKGGFYALCRSRPGAVLIYFDTCYIVKCYFSEQGSEAVRQLTGAGESVGSCELARIEFFSAVHRHFREGKISGKTLSSVFHRFREDEHAGYWTWFPIHSKLMEECCAIFETLPPSVYLRSADALHLCCAKAKGFKTLYTNDENISGAAPHFGLKVVDVTSKIIG